MALVQWEQPYVVGLEPDLFIIDNTITKQRWIERHSFDLKQFSQVPESTLGYISKFKMEGDRSVHLEDEAATYLEWSEMLRDPVMDTIGDGTYLYTWLPQQVLDPISKKRGGKKPYPFTLGDIRDSMRNAPADVLFKGVPILVKASGIQEAVYHPDFLKYVMGGLFSMTALYNILPEFMFSRIIDYGVMGGMQIAIAFSTTAAWAAYEAGKSFFGVGVSLTTMATASAYKTLKVVYPRLKVLVDRTTDKVVPDVYGREPLNMDRINWDLPDGVNGGGGGSTGSSYHTAQSATDTVYFSVLTNCSNNSVSYGFGGFSIELVPVPPKFTGPCAREKENYFKCLAASKG